MKNSSVKTKLIAILLANVLAISFYYLAFSKIKEKDNTASTLEKETTELALKEGGVQLLKRQIAESTKDIENIDSYILSEERTVEFLEMIESLGERRGVKISVKNIDSESIVGRGSDIIEKLNLQIDGKGSWNSVYSFISALEYLPYSTEIRQTQIEKVKDKELGEVWKVDVKINVLKFK